MASTSLQRLITLFRENYLLIGVLIGAALVSFSLGPYANFDTQVEFAAASSVVSQGLPYSSPGNLVNQPPLGFYFNAVPLRVIGLSYVVGVGSVTLWGVGCVFLVYLVGKALYTAKTGLIAAAVFALMPWEAVLSRSFLIDVPCLFFSLLALLLSFYAVRRASLGLALTSGILFGVAFLTKFFAVFTLIPLALLFVRYPPRNLRRGLAEVGLFAAPALLMYYVWYETITKLGFFSFVGHNDFSSFTQDVTPSPYFLLNFFVSNPGIPILLAVGVSLLVLVWTRGVFKSSFFDVVCLATIVGTAGVNMFLVLALNLNVPYFDPVKYDYQLLPAICLLAASLLEKTQLIRSRSSEQGKRSRFPFYLSVVGVVLLAVSIAVNGLTLGSLVGMDSVLFRVEGDVAFSFMNVGLVSAAGSQYLMLALGFLMVVACMVLAVRGKMFRKTVSQA